MTSKNDKPEMPERIWAWNDRFQGHRFGVEDTTRMPLPVDKKPIEYLRADKVREAFREMLEEVCCGEPDCICNGYIVRMWANKIFPEGVERKEDK